MSKVGPAAFRKDDSAPFGVLLFCFFGRFEVVVDGTVLDDIEGDDTGVDVFSGDATDVEASFLKK